MIFNISSIEEALNEENNISNLIDENEISDSLAIEGYSKTTGTVNRIKVTSYNIKYERGGKIVVFGDAKLDVEIICQNWEGDWDDPPVLVEVERLYETFSGKYSFDFFFGERSNYNIEIV